MVTVCAEPVMPMGSLPKARLAGDRLTMGEELLAVAIAFRVSVEPTVMGAVFWVEPAVSVVPWVA